MAFGYFKKAKIFSSQQINLLGYQGPEKGGTHHGLWNGNVGPGPAGHWK